MLHKFELPISWAELQSFGGPQDAHQRGFLVRKQQIEAWLVECEIRCVSRLEQKIEAPVGCQVQKNDGKRHALERKKKKKVGGH